MNCRLPVVSFPKSGRTWLRYGATLAGLDPDFTHAGHPTHIAYIGQPFQGIPLELRDRPVFFLHRNPIDTAVSYFFQLLHKDCVPGRKTWRKRAEIGPLPPTDINIFVTSPVWGVQLVCDFNRAWIDHATGTPGSVVMTYEEFHDDPACAFTRFFDAMGHPFVDAADIADRTTFEKMRSLQASEDGAHHRLTQPFANDPESGKVRRGKVRGYRDYLSNSAVTVCRNIARERGFKA